MTGTELHHQTPLFESMQMSAVAGVSVLLKMDCYQPCGSFKIRGIGRVCRVGYATPRLFLGRQRRPRRGLQRTAAGGTSDRGRAGDDLG